MNAINDQHSTKIIEFTALPMKRKRGRPSKASLAAEAETRQSQDPGKQVSPRPRVAGDYGRLSRRQDLEASFISLIDEALTAIENSRSIPDEILGCYAPLASLLRSISFHEGKLLERGLAAVAGWHPDLEVICAPVKLPLVQAAVEAISSNSWNVLEGVSFDADASAGATYRPDLIIVDKKKRKALIIDLKRSLASYGDSTRLAELKARMMAGALVLPDFLYRRHKRLSVEGVVIAVIDGASRSGDRGQGVWKLSELDELLELPGAAVAMDRLRAMFGERVRALIEQHAAAALGLGTPTTSVASGSTSRTDPAPRVTIGFA